MIPGVLSWSRVVVIKKKGFYTSEAHASHALLFRPGITIMAPPLNDELLPRGVHRRIARMPVQC